MSKERSRKCVDCPAMILEASTRCNRCSITFKWQTVRKLAPPFIDRYGERCYPCPDGFYRSSATAPFGLAERCAYFPNEPSDIGYVSINRGGHIYGHVLIYTEAHGPVPDNLELDHLCSRRSCAELSHLEVVTHAENIRRGFQRRGGGPKLTPADVSTIRERRKNGEKQSRIAADYNVDPSHVSRIATGQYWKEG